MTRKFQPLPNRINPLNDVEARVIVPRVFTNIATTASIAETRPRVADDVYTDMTMEIGMAKAIMKLVHDAGGSGNNHATMAVYAAHGHLETAFEFAEKLYGMKSVGAPQS